MTRSCVIIGGTGYVGRNLAARLSANGRFDRILLVDQASPKSSMKDPRIEYLQHDARLPFDLSCRSLFEPCEWIFHLAAVHREPGHEASEYFRTNIPSAHHVSQLATDIGCKNIFFTSSIAVYGRTTEATDEHASLEPFSPYGISKLCSELILQKWQVMEPGRRLIVVRPGVIYGAGDPGNIGRLIRAIANGSFVFPGRRDIRKSYGYIEGLLDSIEFTMGLESQQLTYNYVERDTLPLNKVVETIASFIGCRNPQWSIPLGGLAAIASVVNTATGGRSPIHPARVRKAALQTWIVPQQLIDLGFPFRFDFQSSLEDWKRADPGFFDR